MERWSISRSGKKVCTFRGGVDEPIGTKETTIVRPMPLIHWPNLSYSLARFVLFVGQICLIRQSYLFHSLAFSVSFVRINPPYSSISSSSVPVKSTAFPRPYLFHLACFFHLPSCSPFPFRVFPTFVWGNSSHRLSHSY